MVKSRPLSNVDSHFAGRMAATGSPGRLRSLHSRSAAR